MASLPADPVPAVAAPNSDTTSFPTAESLAPTAPTANDSSKATPAITLRAPSTSSTPSATTIPPPTLSWLRGPWNVTHSTLPMWRKAQNVRITYTPIANSGSAGGLGHVGGTHLDDEVRYESLGGKGRKVSTVKGVDKPFPTAETKQRGVGHHVDTARAPSTSEGEELASLGYTWRGKGWLVIATSKWEILGYGDEEGKGNSWVVTYFAKTLFTPAGVDFYSREGRLDQRTVEGIKEALKTLGGDVAKLGGELFEVAMDGEGQ